MMNDITAIQAAEPLDGPMPAGPVGAAPPETPTAPAAPALPVSAAPLPPTAEQIAAWQTQAAKAAEHWDRYVRAVADLENFRKRAARERQDASRQAVESLLLRLLPVLDNFDMAQAAADQAQETTLESLKTGVGMISSQLRSALADEGLQPIDATGQPFDPNWHEAIAQQDCAETPEGHVLQQTRRGYKYRDRLLRAASVVVARKPAAA